MVSENHDIDGLMEFAEEVIRLSGEEVVSYFGKGVPQVKFDESLVTEAELHLSEFMKDQLYARFPEHQVFNSEQANEGYTHGKKRYVWIYDPLDGVANFQAGIPIWGISMALLDNFWPIFGLFYMPATGDLFQARAGGEAFWGKRGIRVSSQEEINDESLLLSFSRFHQRYRTTFPGKVRDFGCTGAHICYVAAGRAEAAIIANESFQELAAVRVIVEAAGGKLLKLDGREFFLNDHLDGQKIEEHLLVTGPDMYDEVRQSLQEMY